MTYKILVTETLSRIVEVKADDFTEAISKVEKMYDDAEIVLDYNDLCDVDFRDESEVL